MKLPRLLLFLIIWVALAATATITTTETTSPVIAPAPGAYEILSQDGSIRIPFDIFREDIRMQAMVNGVEVDLR